MSVTLPPTGFLPVYYPAQKDTVRVVSSRNTRIGGWALHNPNATTAFIQFFATNATVTLGTTVPNIVMPLPAGASANMLSDKGIFMADGLQVACTTTSTGSTPPTTGLDVTLFYQ